MIMEPLKSYVIIHQPCVITNVTYAIKISYISQMLGSVHPSLSHLRYLSEWTAR